MVVASSERTASIADLRSMRPVNERDVGTSGRLEVQTVAAIRSGDETACALGVRAGIAVGLEWSPAGGDSGKKLARAVRLSSVGRLAYAMFLISMLDHAHLRVSSVFSSVVDAVTTHSSSQGTVQGVQRVRVISDEESIAEIELHPSGIQFPVIVCSASPRPACSAS